MKVHYSNENQLIVGRFFSDLALKKLKSRQSWGLFNISAPAAKSSKKAGNFSDFFLR